MKHAGNPLLEECPINWIPPFYSHSLAKKYWSPFYGKQIDYDYGNRITKGSWISLAPSCAGKTSTYHPNLVGDNKIITDCAGPVLWWHPLLTMAYCTKHCNPQRKCWFYTTWIITKYEHTLWSLQKQAKLPEDLYLPIPSSMLGLPLPRFGPPHSYEQSRR